MLKFVGCKKDGLDAAGLHLVLSLMNQLCYDHSQAGRNSKQTEESFPTPAATRRHLRATSRRPEDVLASPLEK